MGGVSRWAAGAISIVVGFLLVVIVVVVVGGGVAVGVAVWWIGAGALAIVDALRSNASPLFAMPVFDFGFTWALPLALGVPLGLPFEVHFGLHFFTPAPAPPLAGRVRIMYGRPSSRWYLPLVPTARHKPQDKSYKSKGMGEDPRDASSTFSLIHAAAASASA